MKTIIDFFSMGYGTVTRLEMTFLYLSTQDYKYCVFHTLDFIIIVMLGVFFILAKY